MESNVLKLVTSKNLQFPLAAALQTQRSLRTAESNALQDQLSLVVRKPVFGVSDQVPHKPGCTTKQDGYTVEA